MSKTTRMIHTSTERRDERRARTPSKPPNWDSAMTYLVLIAVIAALLTGVLALPFTMPGRALSGPPTALGAADFGLPATVRTTARRT